MLPQSYSIYFVLNDSGFLVIPNAHTMRILYIKVIIIEDCSS